MTPFDHQEHKFALLDMLRWVSASLVAISHIRTLLFLDYGAVPHSSIFIRAFYAVTGLGHEAVIVFFILSGYLVGGSLIDKDLDRASLSNYFIHRFSRIYIVLLPALAATVVLDVIGSSILATPAIYDQADWANSLDFVTAKHDTFGILICNAANLQDAYCPSFGSNAPLWSLAYEWFYYLTFPLLLATLRGLWKHELSVSRTTFYALGLLLLAFFFSAYLIYYPIWLMGVAARMLGSRYKIPFGCAYLAAVAAFILFVIARAHIVPGPLTDNAIGLALATLLSCSPLVASARALRKFNAVLASYSFSLYVIHFPLLVFADAVLLRSGAIEGRLVPSAKAFGLFAGYSIFVYGVAWTFSLATERQTAKLRRQISNQLIRLRSKHPIDQRSPDHPKGFG